MSQFYEMRVEISGHDPVKAEQVREAAETQWPFGDWWFSKRDDGREAMHATGQSLLYAGESEEQFTERLSLAVWTANQAYCNVGVDAVYLEELPAESYSLGEEDYQRLMKEQSGVRDQEILMTLQVIPSDEADAVSAEAMEKAAAEAVSTAIKAAEEGGFCHSWADRLCIGFVDAVVYEEDDP